MTTIALIAEGLTDQLIIERLIEAVYDDIDNADEGGLIVSAVQPIRDRTDAFHAPHAGWEKVFEYCQTQLASAVAANDFVVIHVDTDDGDHVNFGLGLTTTEGDKTYNDLVEQAKVIILKKIGNQIQGDDFDKLIFAIAVHAIESWILLINYKEDKIKSSFKRLDFIIKNKSKGKSKGKGIKKCFDDYSGIANGMNDDKILCHLGGSHSLGIFLDSVSQALSSKENN